MITRTIFQPFLAATLLVLSTLTAPARADDKDHEIDLRLFGQNVIAPWDGCHFAFWQADRDPENDEFAYVFYAPIPDGEALPAWVKIGEDIIEVTPVDTGAADRGDLAPALLYRDSESRLTVIADILEQGRVDAGLEIRDARLTFVMKDKFPFSIRVKGINGCPSGPGAALAESQDTSDPAVTLGAEAPFEGLDTVPASVMAAIRERAPDCNPEMTAGFGSLFEVNGTMQLWQVPCNLYAAAGSSVFVLEQDQYAVVLPFSMPPGADMNDEVEMLNATVDPQTASVTAFSLDSGGDCGTFTRHQLRPLEGEQLYFAITEYREKIECDGKAGDPADFPLVYRE